MGQSDEMAKSFDDVINLSLGDPDMTTPEPIIEAAFRDAKAGHTKYTDFRGDPELRAEICRYYEKNFGMPVRDEEVAARILQEAHVLMLPGNAFGACGEGYLRMACTVDKAVIEEAFARIGRMAPFGK